MESVSCIWTPGYGPKKRSVFAGWSNISWDHWKKWTFCGRRSAGLLSAVDVDFLSAVDVDFLSALDLDFVGFPVLLDMPPVVLPNVLPAVLLNELPAVLLNVLPAVVLDVLPAVVLLNVLPAVLLNVVYPDVCPNSLVDVLPTGLPFLDAPWRAPGCASQSVPGCAPWRAPGCASWCPANWLTLWLKRAYPTQEILIGNWELCLQTFHQIIFYIFIRVRFWYF